LDLAVLRGTFAWFTAHPKTLSQFEYCGINLSGSSVGDADLVRRVREALVESRLPPGKFMFEITEGQTIARPARAAETIRSLRGMGCKIAIDDFGTGLATFDYLKRFEIDCIKIDGSFIHALANNELDAAIVSSIVNVARAISVRTVAEYVGDNSTLELVTRLGVDASQGWAIGPPLPLAEYFAMASTAAAGANVTPLHPRRVAQSG
jgi:EAL domain-containing protein (putative c-di-GMP-specific phosphodiesterase class I)